MTLLRRFLSASLGWLSGAKLRFGFDSRAIRVDLSMDEVREKMKKVVMLWVS